MIDKFPVKTLIAVFIAIFVWALMPANGKNDGVENNRANAAGETSNLVSAIRPVSEVDAAEPGVASGRLPVLTERSVEQINSAQLIDLHDRFKSANVELAQGQQQQAEVAYKLLIKDYPSIVEPYLNLASIYASQSKLSEAREVLLEGFDANPKAGMLFDHLSTVHGALAAQSYQQALDTKTSRDTPTVSLARASTIVTSLDQQEQIASLTQQLSTQQNQTSGADQTRRLQELEAQVQQLRQNAESSQTALKSELSNAKARVADLSQSLTQSQAAEREALARVVRAEQDSSGSLSELNAQLSESQAALLSANTQLKEQAPTLARAEQVKS